MLLVYYPGIRGREVVLASWLGTNTIYILSIVVPGMVFQYNNSYYNTGIIVSSYQTTEIFYLVPTVGILGTTRTRKLKLWPATTCKRKKNKEEIFCSFSFLEFSQNFNFGFISLT